MGIGSGYLEGEFKALGAQFAGRGVLMDEAIELMKLVWTGQSVAFSGQYFQADGNTALPVPLQHPHPPIWVGGNGDRAIRRAVETCDGWSPFPVKGKFSARVRTDEIASVEDLKRKIEQAKEMGDKIGRIKPLDVCMTPFAMTMQTTDAPEAAPIVDGLAALAEVGVTWTSIALPCRDRRHYLDNIDWFAREVIAVVRPA
jgi:alkanesulfonate monooxygenase SsuD/methylene tetrahydromethanopterin reductase-like flavin-dependent oxidoreductase (luciferase family)